MDELSEYQKTSRSTVNRLAKRAAYDQAVIHDIINKSPVVHVSFVPTSLEDDPFPAILPMLGCIGSYPSPNEPNAEPTTSLYLHGYVSSRLMQLPSKKSEEDYATNLPGAPVAVAATLVDGLVLALSTFNHSCNYRSAIIHGYATVVVDPAEKLYALEAITNNVVPDRWNNARVPPTEAEMKSTGVLKVDIVSASAKIRASGPGDDKADLNDEAMRERVWTGVIPTWVNYGSPIPAEGNRVEKVPEYLGNWRSKENEKNKGYAEEVAVAQYGKK